MTLKPSSTTTPPGAPIQSMTGFASVEATLGEQRVRLELKTLNHRMLDIKLRLPREWQPAELALKAALQGAFQRGSLELKLERLTEATASESIIQLAKAQSYFQELQKLKAELQLSEPIRLSDLLALPEVIARPVTQDFTSQEAWQMLAPLVQEGIQKLRAMREHEGATLVAALLLAIEDLEKSLTALRARRKECEADWRKKIEQKVQAVFEAYPLAQESVQTVLESRIAQELALIIDRTDIEEELTRFSGHLSHVRKTLEGGGPVGRKIDFLLQELNREINTLGNKSQDALMSSEVVAVKVRLEQLREQVMNLE